MADVIYKHSVEAFINGVIVRNGLLSLEFDKELRALGVNPTSPRDVDLATWTKLIRLVAARLSPGAPEPEAIERVGREHIRGFAESLVGKGLFMLLRLMGPHRTVQRMAENFRSADSVTEVTVTRLGPNRYLLLFNTTGDVPWFVSGLLEEAMRLLQMKSTTVTWELRADGTAFTLTLQE